MLFIKKNNLQDFEELQQRIHEHRIATIQGYSASKWAEYIKGKDGTYICPIEENDLSVLTLGESTVEISTNDENYFQKRK